MITFDISSDILRLSNLRASIGSHKWAFKLIKRAFFFDFSSFYLEKYNKLP